MRQIGPIDPNFSTEDGPDADDRTGNQRIERGNNQVGVGREARRGLHRPAEKLRAIHVRIVVENIFDVFDVLEAMHDQRPVEPRAVNGDDLVCVPAGKFMQALVDDASSLEAPTFATRYGIRRGYCSGGTRWFERVLTVPPRWNRLIVYSGTILHSGDIPAPHLLVADPRKGRLTLNAFLTCRRQLSA